MSVEGYETGPITCQAAFIADFDVSPQISIAELLANMERGRKSMDVRPGMRSKYVPLRFDPATGAHQIGGRYLFDTWENVVDYMKFTTEELELEPGVKFWNRPFFSNIDKRAWRVVGAHDFTPLSTHYASRFERFACDPTTSTANLKAAWPGVCKAARDIGLASVWLLIQPDERQIGILTVSMKLPGTEEAERASRSIVDLEQTQSLINRVSGHTTLRRLFDRTSLNLALWLPQSRRLGGDPSIFPVYPVHPLPSST